MPEESIKIRSSEIQDILTKTPHWMITWGNGILLMLIAMFFIFTWFIRYPDVITSEALITSSNPPQKEYAPLSGRIDTLLVGDDEMVRKGEILAVIENPALFSDVMLLKSILDTISFKGEAFKFPVENLPLLSLGDIAPAYTIFLKDYTDYQLNLSLNPYQNELQGQSLSQSQIRLRIKSLEDQKVFDEQKFELTKNEFERNRKLYEKGVLSLNEFETRKLTYLDREKNLNNLDISISQLKQALNDSYQNTRSSQINYQREDTRLYKNLVQAYTQLKLAISSWELKYVLASKVYGRVSFINVWNENQFVKQGDLMFTIIPETGGSYIAKIKAPVQNSGKISNGQKVNIKLLNFPETEYGMLDARVESMSAIPDEEGYYLVQASLNSDLITSYEIEIPFRNEMMGTAEIITEDLRLLERFFYQLKGLFN